MEPISSLLLTGLGYVLKGAAQSQTAATAKEEILGRFWQWVRPRFIKEVPHIESEANTPETEQKTLQRLLELVKDEDFYQELAKKIAELKKAGIKEKNIVHGSISDVTGSVRIGDREYSPDETYHRKNIVEGDVRSIGGDFILGDDH
ncbi:MAG: hypothetical protein HGA78_00580 [Nitrospirales bacterium]|nr:hypothetical protein [Nitrospirales bacterium]